MFQLNEINYRKVTFSCIVRVVYIPTKEATNDIKEALWWSEYDHITASNNSLLELKKLMNIHPSMNIKHAKKLLYQPNNLTIYDPSNFDYK
jgi:hypothetical protein